jgi:hypothetical protein
LGTLALLACLGPDDVSFQDPARAVVDARRMIEEKRADPEAHPGWIEPGELPVSLRIQGLNYAVVHEDHVDLVLVRSPDWEAGARIWSTDARRRHADRPTEYPDIFFFEYSEDLPEAPDNMF